jgi:hypothetical protein
VSGESRSDGVEDRTNKADSWFNGDNTGNIMEMFNSHEMRNLFNNFVREVGRRTIANGERPEWLSTACRSTSTELSVELGCPTPFGNDIRITKDDRRSTIVQDHRLYRGIQVPMALEIGPTNDVPTERRVGMGLNRLLDI